MVARSNWTVLSEKSLSNCLVPETTRMILGSCSSLQLNLQPCSHPGAVQ